MNLDIRAWLKDEDRMVNVAITSFIGEEFDCYDGDSSSGDWYSFNDAIFMQFTGLLDKKGKKIYEGDIVRFRDACDYKHTWSGFVDFADGSFRINGDFIKHYRWIDYEVEVIGNIHENPELLKEVK